jgi:hypothetical protein
MSDSGKTFTIEAYKGWTEAQLKRRCRELVSACTGKDMLICALVDFGGIDKLPRFHQDQVKRIWNAYCDDDELPAMPVSNGHQGGGE